MSNYNDKKQEGLVARVMKEFEGKEEKTMRTDSGIKVEQNWLKLEDGEWFEGIYKGFDDLEVDKFGNKKFYFEVEGAEKFYSQASNNKSFLLGIQDKKMEEKIKVGRIGVGKETKYIVTLV